MAKDIHQAKLHARGLKTRDALNSATLKMDAILKSLDNDLSSVVQRKVLTKSKNICPEIYKSAEYGFPLFDDGYVNTACTYNSSLDKLVSIVVVYDRNWEYNISKVLNGISEYNSNIKVHIALHEELKHQLHYLTSHPNVGVTFFFPKQSIGDVYNDIIKDIKTEYTLIANSLIDFNSDVRLDRLIREHELLDLSISGGSIRNSSDVWTLGCYQRAELNFSLVYRHGYDESIHDCVFCDHIDGPFIIKTSILQKTKFNSKFTLDGLFEDFFLRINGEVAVCPDAMFHVHKPKLSTDSRDWMLFGRDRNLFELSFTPDDVIRFGCGYKYPCRKSAGYIIHPCCVNDLLNLTNTIMELCNNAGMYCEPHGGTILGPIKMENALPWERDADIRVLADNFTSDFLKLKDSFIKKGFKWTDYMPPKGACPKLKKVGYVNIHSAPHWKADVYMYCNMSSVEGLKRGISRTLVKHRDQFIHVPRNPPLAARNRYPDLYKHAEHCSVLKIGAEDVYKKHGFKSCPKNLESQCLTRFNPDGNLQFFTGLIP